MTGPTRDFWQERLAANDTPWDRGDASPQLAAWLGSIALTPCRILVPGCGAGHEVAVLAGAGFDVTALDYAPAAIDLTRERLARANLQATLVQADALEWQPATPSTQSTNKPACARCTPISGESMPTNPRFEGFESQ